MSHRAASWLDMGHAAGPVPDAAGSDSSHEERPSLARAPDELTALDIASMTCRSLNVADE